MACKDILENLQDYLDGDMKEKYSQEIEDHLVGCHKCREEYKVLREISELFRKEPIPIPNETQWNNTWKKIEIGIGGPKSSFYREIMIGVDTLAMKFFFPQSLRLRLAMSMGLFVLGVGLGAIYLTPSGQIYQKVVKVENRVQNEPVIQQKDLAGYLTKQVAKYQAVNNSNNRFSIATAILTSVPASNDPMDDRIYLANESAPFFPASHPADLTADSPVTTIPAPLIDNAVNKLEQNLAPGLIHNQRTDSNKFIRVISTTQ